MNEENIENLDQNSQKSLVESSNDETEIEKALNHKQKLISLFL